MNKETFVKMGDTGWRGAMKCRGEESYMITKDELNFIHKLMEKEKKNET